jgi:hypothetical protein
MVGFITFRCATHVTACGLLFSAAASSFAADVDFARDVRPILSRNCFACHGPDAGQREADLRLDRFEDSDDVLGAAAVVVPGNAAESELIARITSDDVDVVMPPPDSGKSLTAEQIEVLRRWIEEGAEYAAHWAFVPPQRPAAPTVADEARVRNPIDAFVLARLEREGLSPSEEADRRTLIRRVTLDLTGLPPTREDVAAFVNDTSPRAYEKVVDRLLSSHSYAEHMARDWLDAARYADTNGYQYDLEREQWVWRDWVIDAFDTNMPFDEFTIQQLAGDLLPDATDQTRLATAFHRNHPITIEGGVIDEEYRTEYVIDRVVTTSTVWMGLTMTCCRCHDHKYDPFTQRDFYGMFAFFNQVPERGLQGFDPKLTIPSPLASEQIERIDGELNVAETALAERISAVEGDFETWEHELADQVRNQWTIVVPESRVSEGGATFELLPDNSLLATGAKPATDVYEFRLSGTGRPIHAVRIEALTHESLVDNSTGRASNGNFVLSEFDVAAGSDDEFQPVKVASAEADYSQANYDIAGAIDGKIDRTGWAVDGNTKHENRVAVFRLEEPLAAEAGAQIRIRLHFAWGGSHAIGRVRLSLAERPLHDVPTDIAEIVSLDTARRSPEQTEQLRQYLIRNSGDAALQEAGDVVARLRAQRQQLAKAPATMVMSDRDQPRTTHILERGEYDKPRDVVPPHTPDALRAMPEDAPRSRLGFANWLVSPEHPLTARVTVNRVWSRLFGRGIVETVEDFGTQGSPPSHPELLDWLAVEFVESGWDLKALLRQIVTSATYRQSSTLTDDLRQRDPENRLLARGSRFRLDAEVIRDSALAVSGLLVDRVGGPSVFPYHPPGLWQEINNRPGYSRTYVPDTGENLYRRSLYTFWKRTVPPPSMATFDAPAREYCIVRRSRTNTPLQAFVLLHDPQFVEAARHLGGLIMATSGSDADRIAAGFERVTARRPTEEELAVLREVHAARLAQYRKDPAAVERLLNVGDSSRDDALDPIEHAAWTTTARVLLNLSEFITRP